MDLSDCSSSSGDEYYSMMKTEEELPKREILPRATTTHSSSSYSVTATSSSSTATTAEDFSWPENKAHPLLIPWVVQQVFEYLPLKIVEKQLSVCKLWLEEATKIIRKNKVMVFYEEEVIKHYNSVMRFTFSMPHTAFEFHTCNLSSTSKHFNEFWQLFGNNIKRLEFHQSTIDGQALHKILTTDAPNLECLLLRNPPKIFPYQENSCKTFPNLKEIIFQFFPYSDLESRVCVKHLFMAAPNLETIRFLPLSTGERIHNRMMNIIHHALTDSELSISLPRLSEIDTRLEFSNNHVTELLVKRFPLVNLDVILTTDVKSKDFREYLSSLSGSLNKLNITFPPRFIDCQNCFLSPSGRAIKSLCNRFLFNLTHLTLSSYYGSLSFLINLQNLKSLNLLGVNLAESVPNRFERPHGLQIFKADTVADCSTIYKLSSCFPTLKVLHVTGVNDDSLRTIYREMPFLTELILKKGNFTDTGISGVSPEVCLDMAETTTYIDANAERLRLDLYIGSLPNLSTLKLESPFITDLSIILGIISCLKLKSLSLQSEEITDTGMRTIGMKMDRKLTYLDIAQCCGVSEAGKFYVKEKLKGRYLVLEPPRPVGLSFQSKPHRFIVTVKGRRELPRPRPDGWGPSSSAVEELPTNPRARARMNLRLHNEAISLETEMFHRHRNRILTLHEQVQEDAAIMLNEEPILEGNILDPLIQRQLLEAAHDAAALELNAGMLQLFPMPDHRNAMRLDPQVDQRGLEAQFIDRRRQIFLEMVRTRRNLERIGREELPMVEVDDQEYDDPLELLWL